VSSLLKHIIVFSEFSPDSNEFDGRFLERVINMIPVFSTHRQLAKLDTVTSITGADSPPSGSHIHRTSESAGTLTLALDADDTLPAQSDYKLVQVGGPTREVYTYMNQSEPNDIEVYRAFSTGSDVIYIAGIGVPATVDPNGNVTVTYRYRLLAGSGSVTIDVDLLDTSDVVIGTGDTVSTSFPATTGDWVNGSFTETLTADADFKAQLKVNGAAQSVIEYAPDADVDFSNWVKSDPLATTGAELIDKTGGDDDTKFVTSPPLTVGQKSSAEFAFADAVPEDIDNGSTHTVEYEYKGSDAGMDLTVGVYDNGLLIREDTYLSIPTTKTNQTINLTQPQVDSINNYDDLQIKFEFTGVGSGVGTQNGKPTGDSFDGDFTKFPGGGQSQMYNQLNDDSDSTGVESNETVTTDTSVTFDSIITKIYDQFEDPQAEAGTYELRVRVRSQSGTGTCKITLSDGDTGQKWQDQTFTTQAAWEWRTLNFAAKKSVINENRFRVRVDKRGGDIGYVLQVADMEINMPLPEQDSTGTVYKGQFDYAGFAGVDFSWVQPVADLTGTFFPGNLVKFYLGTNKALYEGLPNDYAMVDVSKTSDESYTDAGASGWQFATWGDKIVATNFIDEIQLKDTGDTRFEDLLTTGVPTGALKLRARHVAAISSQLCLGNINPDSHASGRPHTFWCSAYGDLQNFQLADVQTQSTFFQMIQQPGEITGLVGGEYGLIFKENSLYRAEYVGLPLIFDFDEISKTQGTPYSRSIVQAEGDVYFWGSGGIFVIEGGNTLKRIGETKMEKYLFDSNFEINSLNPNPGDDMRNNWGAVFGSYCPYSGLVFWSYRLSGDAYGENEGLVIYSRKEDRFTVCDGDDLRLPLDMQDQIDSGVISSLQSLKMSEITSRGNVVTDETHHIRSLWATQSTPNASVFDLDISRFSKETEPQPGFMLTNTFSSATFPEVGAGRSMEIQMIRPIYTLDTPDSTNVNMDIIIAYDDSPDMQNAEFMEGEFSEVEDKWWIPGKTIVGQYFKFLAVLHSTTPAVIKEFTAIEVKYMPRGDFS
jgi:hypothetical protein